MALAKNINELTKLINQKINKALNTNVYETAKQTMQEHIQKDVYDAYTPYSTDGITPHYERTGQLLESIEKDMPNENTLVVKNTRNEKGRDIARVIEEGNGYEWGYKRNLDEEIGKRPFIENTANELANGKAKKALVDGLKQQGLDVK